MRVVRLGEVGFRVADVQLLVVEREGEGEVFVVRLFSGMGVTEVRVEGDKLRKWYPQLGEEMEVEQTGDNDVSEGGDGGDGGGGGSSSIGGIHVEKTGGGGGGYGHDHDHDHSHSRSHSLTLTDITSKKGQFFHENSRRKGGMDMPLNGPTVPPSFTRCLVTNSTI